MYAVATQGGGHVTLDSTPGAGTTVRVYLPLVTEGLPAAESTAAAAGAHTRPAVVLLVDDQEPVRQFVARALAQLGHTVLEAESGAQALALAAAHDGAVDLLVSDVLMPGLSGPDLAAQLRAGRPGLRVLFISGHTDDTVDVTAAHTYFLAKPFTVDTLALKVSEALG